MSDPLKELQEAIKSITGNSPRYLKALVRTCGCKIDDNGITLCPAHYNDYKAASTLTPIIIDTSKDPLEFGRGPTRTSEKNIERH